MRLLVRGNAHRLLDGGGTELASSPDTAGRERWRWDLRLSDPPEERSEHTRQHRVSMAAQTAPSTLALTFDPAQIEADLQVLDVDTATHLDRSLGELLIVIASEGNLLVERRHRMSNLDVLVLEGDDPLSVAIEPEHGPTARGAIARISYVDGTRVAWVP